MWRFADGATGEAVALGAGADGAARAVRIAVTLMIEAAMAGAADAAGAIVVVTTHDPRRAEELFAFAFTTGITVRRRSADRLARELEAERGDARCSCGTSVVGGVVVDAGESAAADDAVGHFLEADDEARFTIGTGRAPRGRRRIALAFEVVALAKSAVGVDDVAEERRPAIDRTPACAAVPNCAHAERRVAGAAVVADGAERFTSECIVRANAAGARRRHLQRARSVARRVADAADAAQSVVATVLQRWREKVDVLGRAGFAHTGGHGAD